MPPVGLARKGLMQNNIDTTGDLLKIRSLDAGIAQLVEHNLAKVGVASSSLVSRSKRFQDGARAAPLSFEAARQCTPPVALEAERQSGYAAACKAVYVGSIPSLASSIFIGISNT